MSDEVSYAEGEISKIDNETHRVFGWAYTTHDKDGNVVIDKSGEYIDDTEELEKAAYKFVINSRQGGTDHLKNADGTPIVKSHMVESMVFTPEKCQAMGIPPGTLPVGAWWVGFQIEDDEVWKGIQDGRWKMFSIHGKGKKVKTS